MRKTKKIELLLITALVASCNRTLLAPAETWSYPDDSTLLAPSTHHSPGICQPCEDLRHPGTSPIQFTPANAYAYPGISFPYVYHAPVQHGARFVMKGGFGKSGTVSS